MSARDENKKDQQQVLSEIGTLLRKTREAKQLTLEIAQEQTKIRQHYLQALENGQKDVLPGEVYLKGFLKNYACFLGLTGDELVKRYSESEKHEQASFGGSEQRDLWSPPIQSRFKRQTILLIALLALLIVVAIALTKGIPSTGTGRVEPVETPEVADPIPPGLSSDSIDGDTTPAALPICLDKIKETETEIIYHVNVSPLIELHLTADRCWMAIRTDDAAEVTETLIQGDRRTISAIDNIWLRAGNPQVVDITINGTHIGPAGKTGQPRNIVVRRYQ
ncbi:MAG TPA: RodZ domain-containing protein [bacterium]|nr:RodZ domain-containing protein [bacterium]